MSSGANQAQPFWWVLRGAMKVANPGAHTSPAAAAAAAFRTEVEANDREMRAKEHKSLQGFDPGEAGSGGEDASEGEVSMCAGGVFGSPSSSQTNALGAPLPRKPELKVGTVDRIQAILATGAFARLVEGPLAIADDSIPSDPMPSTELVGKSRDSECVSSAHPRHQSPDATDECTPQRSLPPSCLAHFPTRATPGSTVSLRTPGSHDSRRLAEADETFALDSSSEDEQEDEQEDERALGGSGSSSPTPAHPAQAPPRPAAPPAAPPAASAVTSPAGSTEPESRSAAKALREMMESAEVSLQRDFDGLHAFADFADFSGSEAEDGGMAEDEAAEEMRTAERRRLRETEAEARGRAEAQAAEASRRVEERRAVERRRRESVSPGAEAYTSPRGEAYTRTLSSNSRPSGTPPQREAAHAAHAAHAPGYVDLDRLGTSQAPHGGGGACAGSDDEGAEAAAAAAEAEAAAAELFRRQRSLQGGPLSPERSFHSPSHWQSVAAEAV